MRADRHVVEIGEVGIVFGLKQAARLGYVDLCDVASLMNDEGKKAAPDVEVFAGEDGHRRFFRELDPCIQEVWRERVFEPHGAHGGDGASEIERIAPIELPMRMDGNTEVETWKRTDGRRGSECTE